MTKLRRYGIIFLVLLMALVSAPMAMAEVKATIGDLDSLKKAFSTGGSYQLSANISVDCVLATSQDIELDLNGHTISTSEDINIGDYAAKKSGKLTLSNTSKEMGGITFTLEPDYGNKIYGKRLNVYSNRDPKPTNEKEAVDSVLTINSGVRISASGYYTVYLRGKGATLNLDGGEIIAAQTIGSAAIQGNGTANVGDKTGTYNEAGTIINIKSGKVAGGPVLDENKEGGVAIYHPQEGELNIYGGVITGYDGVQFKGGSLTI